MTTAGEFCNRNVVTVERTTSLIEAARRMREHHIGDVIVVEDQNGRPMPVGIVTDRDIVVGILAVTPERIGALSVGDVVTRQLVTAEEDERLEDVLKNMRSFGVRRIPVVNRNGGLVGVVTFDDTLKLLAEQLSDLARLLSREWKHEEVGRP